jgi:hypothetical protein
MDSVVNIIKDMWDWIAALWDTFTQWISALVLDVFSTMLGWASAAINAIPVPAVLQNFDPWAWVNPTASYLLNQLHVPECLLIISAGWAIRFALNLIPSWATRI